jgi:hypothetical protein
MAHRFWKLIILAVILILVLNISVPEPLTSEAAYSTSLNEPSLWVTPLVLDFGPVGVGYTSSTLTATITNIGNAMLAGFAGGGVYPPFSDSQNCAVGVPPGGSCQYFFTFSPSEVGNFTTTSSSSSNAGPFTIELRGEGVGAGLHVNPLSLDFGTMHVGHSAPTQVVTIRNTGLSTLAGFAGGGVYPPFGASQNCAAGVLPGESCQYYFDFSPTAAGFFTTTSSSGSNAGPFTIDLMGRGWQNLYVITQRVTPRSLDFGPVGVGYSGETLVVTTTNQGNNTITGWAGGGVYPPFGATQNCAGGVPPGESCQYFFTFNPTETGVFTTTSNTTNSYGSFTIKLRGEGVGAGLSVSPLVLDFGSVQPGLQSAQQIVTIKNTGMAILTNFAGGGLYAPFSATQDCAAGVLPGATCHYYFRFSPTEWGRFSASSNSSTNAGAFSIQVISGLELPSIEMSFYPNTIVPGEKSTLYYTIHNINSSATLFGVSFNNTFPSGMSVASPLSYTISTECGAPIFTPATGETSVSFSNATILGGDDCIIGVKVTVPSIGIYTNTTSQVSSTTGTGNSSSATLYAVKYIFMPIIER